jgi:hypothetical protein
MPNVALPLLKPPTIPVGTEEQELLSNMARLAQ